MGVLDLAIGLSLLASGSAVAESPMPGTVAVTLTGADTDHAASDQPFADAVGQALGTANFTMLPMPGHSRYIAQVSVVRANRGVAPVKVGKEPASAGIGSFGPAIRLPLGSNKTRLRALVVTTLTVRLIERTDQRQVWSASAVTAQVDGTPVAAKLAQAVVATYPQTLPAPVSVP